MKLENICYILEIDQAVSDFPFARQGPSIDISSKYIAIINNVKAFIQI